MRSLLFCLLICGASARAQSTGVITGTVTDEATGDPLIAASVRVDGTRLGAATDIEGRYRIEGVPVGPVRLVASYVGFQTVHIEAVLVDSLRLDIELPWECSMYGVGLSVAVSPRGRVADLPALDARYPPWPGSYTRSIGLAPEEPLAARVARTPAWGRGVDALGRWRPTAHGLGTPQAYVNGLPALSLGGLPVQAAAATGAYAGYLPARYGGSAAGAVVVEAAGGGKYDGVERDAFVSATRDGPGVALRSHTTRAHTDAAACGRLIDRWSLFGEGAVGVGNGAVRTDGRAFGEYVSAPATLDVHLRAGGTTTATGDEGALGGVVRSQRGRYDGVWRLTAGGEVGGRPGATASVASVRAQVGSETVEVGVEAGVRSDDLDAVGSLRRSAVAAYGEARGRRYSDWFGGSTMRAAAGLRIERFEGTLRAPVWTVQPRVLVEAGDYDRRAYAYGVVLAAPSLDGTLVRRSEAGAGARGEVFDWRYPVELTAGAHGYLRSVRGLGRGEVVGVDAEVDALARSMGVGLTVRGRTEWGAADLARWRGTAAVRLVTGYVYRLPFLHAQYGASVDVSEGLGGTRVVEIGGSWEPFEWDRRVSLYGRVVVAGRDAVPCADGLGVLACPAPIGEVALRVALSQ